MRKKAIGHLVKTNPNKAKVNIGKMNLRLVETKDYDKKQQTIDNERYPKQTQTNPNKANFRKSLLAGEKSIRTSFEVSGIRVSK